MNPSLPNRLRGLAALLLLLAPGQAHAVLGGDRSSVATVVDAIAATRIEVKAMSGQGLTLTRIQSEGLEVREYLAESTGKVVGIAWTGMREPRHLDAILGSLMTEYMHSIRDARRGSGPHVRGPASIVHSEHLVIQRFSRMGVSRARIYLSDLPSRVSADAIR